MEPAISFEFFPPKTPEGPTGCAPCASSCNALQPQFCSVTYGAVAPRRKAPLPRCARFCRGPRRILLFLHWRHARACALNWSNCRPWACAAWWRCAATHPAATAWVGLSVRQRFAAFIRDAETGDASH